MPKEHYTQAPARDLAQLKMNAGKNTRTETAWWNAFVDECRKHPGEYLVRASDIPTPALKSLPGLREMVKRKPERAHLLPKMKADARAEQLLLARVSEIEATWGQEPSPAEREQQKRIEKRAAEIMAAKEQERFEAALREAESELR